MTNSEFTYPLLEEIVSRMFEQPSIKSRSMALLPPKDNKQEYAQYIWKSDKVEEFVDIDSYYMEDGHMRIQGYIKFKDHEDLLNISNPRALLQYLKAKGRKEITYCQQEQCYFLEIWSSYYYTLPF